MVCGLKEREATAKLMPFPLRLFVSNVSGVCFFSNYVFIFQMKKALLTKPLTT